MSALEIIGLAALVVMFGPMRWNRGVVRDLHGWRGFGWETDLFNWRLTLGFVSLLFCKFCVLDRMTEISKALADARVALERRSAPVRDE